MAFEIVGYVTSTGTMADSLTLDISGISGIQEGDIVVAVIAYGHTSSGTLAASGYTEAAKLFASDNYNVHLYAGYKVMGAVPDSSVIFSSSAAGYSGCGRVMMAYIVRGGHPTTPVDATVGTWTSSNNGLPNPPAATPTVTGSLCVAVGGAGTSGGDCTGCTAPSGFSDLVCDFGNGAWDARAMIATMVHDSLDTLDPDAFSGMSNSAAWSAAAITFFINPAPASRTPVRVVFEQFFRYTDPYRQTHDLAYHMTEPFRAAFEQVWSVRMRAVFVMSYSDLPKHRARFDQVWERFRKLRNQAKFEYGDKDKLVAVLDQVYRLMGGVRNKADFAWAVTEKPIRSLFDHVYQIKDKNKQRAVLRQLWIMVMGDAILQKDEVAITARRGDEVRTLNRVYDIDQEEDSTLYYQVGDIKIDKANKQDDGLPNGESEYLFCSHLETEVTISVTGGPDKTYLVREPYRDRDAQSGEVFIIPLRSKTILLDEQESDISLVKEGDLIMVHYDGEILTGLSEAEFAALDKSRVTARIDASTAYGMRKSLVEMLAYPFSVDWNLPNTYLSANRLQIDTATRMTKIKEIVASLGGIVQSSDDGEELECKKEYKIPLAKLKQYVPEIELTDQEDAFRITQQHQSRPGYNRFLVTDRDISSDDIRTYNEQITAHQQQVQISWVPNTGQRCTLEKSRGNHVWIVNDGPREEVVETQIEIVAGVGTTLSRPFYGFEMVDGKKSIVWEDVNLGDIEIDESGVVKSTIPGNTLATISYWTKYYQFQVHDPRNENAQVWPVIL